MFVPDYNPKTKTGDMASYDILYKKYTNAYNKAVKNAKKYSEDGEYVPDKPLLSKEHFIEDIIRRAKDPEIAAKYKADKKGIAFLATEMGKKDARKFSKKQAEGLLISQGIKKEDITLHMLSKMMYTTDNMWAQIS